MSEDAIIPIAIVALGVGVAAWIVFVAYQRKLADQQAEHRREVLRIKEGVLLEAIRHEHPLAEIHALLERLEKQENARTMTEATRGFGWTVLTGVASAILGAIAMRMLGLQSGR